jgi:hypothetical protein
MKRSISMKVTILGIDGLDYDVVEDLNLRHLKQEIYGKLTIPPECYRELASGVMTPWTPLCWMSILTGEIPPSHLSTPRSIRYDNKLLESLRWRLGKHLGFIRRKRKIIERMGFKDGTEKRLLKEQIDVRNTSSIFDLTAETIDFHVPTYSETFRLKPKKKISDRRELLPFVDEEFELMKKFMLSVIGRRADYDLFMVYTRVLDNYGHQMFRTEQYNYRYRLMDLFVREVSDKVGGLLLIVSDHGFEELENTVYGGKHSDFAFYSINKDLGTPMNSILDVYGLVEKALKA